VILCERLSRHITQRSLPEGNPAGLAHLARSRPNRASGESSTSPTANHDNRSCRFACDQPKVSGPRRRVLLHRQPVKPSGQSRSFVSANDRHRQNRANRLSSISPTTLRACPSCCLRSAGGRCSDPRSRACVVKILNAPSSLSFLLVFSFTIPSLGSNLIILRSLLARVRLISARP